MCFTDFLIGTMESRSKIGCWRKHDTTKKGNAFSKALAHSHPPPIYSCVVLCCVNVERFPCPVIVCSCVGVCSYVLCLYICDCMYVKSCPEEGACDVHWNEQNLDLDHLDEEEAKEGRCSLSLSLSPPLWIADSPFQVLLFSQKCFFSFVSVYNSFE
jgi:hypothetical protein